MTKYMRIRSRQSQSPERYSFEQRREERHLADLDLWRIRVRNKKHTMNKYRRGTFQRDNMKPKVVAMLDTELGLTKVEVFTMVEVVEWVQWGHVRIIMIIFIIMIITTRKKSILPKSNVVYKVMGQGRDFGISAGFSFH